MSVWPGPEGTKQAPQAQALNLRGQYRLTRLLFLRLLGGIYFVAFLSLSQQLIPLLGTHGLLPARHYLENLESAYGGRLPAFVALPTIFWFDCSDVFLSALSHVGIGLSVVVLLGFANAPLLGLLWFLYLSFVHVGQLFYGYGWEILLLETGFLAIFLCPVLDGWPFASTVLPPTAVIWLLRLVLFRVMFGAGLIKLRGDACWRDLTCMLYHYETQPLPNPFSWYLHQLPPALHKLEVLGNHGIELIVPWTLFAPRRLRHIGGVLLVGFQLHLIISGNLSWLNWLTIALCVPCFDDQALSHLFPTRLLQRLAERAPSAPSRLRQAVIYGLTGLILCLSIGPALNLLVSRQVMNGSFDRLHLVNTYGAFGSIGKRRQEIILEGTSDAAISRATQWQAYEFKCKPGDVERRPCVVAPYHYRLDWQIWFAAMENAGSNPWLLHLIEKLLQNDAGALSLLANNPFPQAPPRFIRAERYTYEFTRVGEPGRAWWKRTRVGTYLPPLSLDNAAFIKALEDQGWR